MSQPPIDPSTPSSRFTRRDFLAQAGRGLAAAALAGEILPASVRAAEGGEPVPKPIELPEIHAKTEQASGQTPNPLPPGDRVGFAVVGLGHLALEEIIPAFGSSKKAKLVALVSGDRDKTARVAREHGIAEKNLYDYRTYDHLKDNPEVQVIYIVLPNGMHAEYTVRGAEAGKHILCEKPMANSAAECEQMIAACKKADRHLMIAYRIQYEPHHRLLQKWVREKKYGPVKLIDSVNNQNQSDPGQWRQNRKLAGGGALPDVGLYCLNTTRFLLGEEPTEVFGMLHQPKDDPRFREVEESVTWQMRFPGGVLSTNTTSYGTHRLQYYRVSADTGWFGADPAYPYQNIRLQGAYAEGPVEYNQHPTLNPKDQFALELDHMAGCVLENKKPYTPGEEGLQDQRIMEAIYESAATGKPVAIKTPGAGAGKLDIFRGEPPKSAA